MEGFQAVEVGVALSRRRGAAVGVGRTKAQGRQVRDSQGKGLSQMDEAWVPTCKLACHPRAHKGTLQRVKRHGAPSIFITSLLPS